MVAGGMASLYFFYDSTATHWKAPWVGGISFPDPDRPGFTFDISPGNFARLLPEDCLQQHAEPLVSASAPRRHPRCKRKPAGDQFARQKGRGQSCVDGAALCRGGQTIGALAGL